MSLIPTCTYNVAVAAANIFAAYSETNYNFSKFVADLLAVIIYKRVISFRNKSSGTATTLLSGVTINCRAHRRHILLMLMEHTPVKKLLCMLDVRPRLLSVLWSFDCHPIHLSLLL